MATTKKKKLKPMKRIALEIPNPRGIIVRGSFLRIDYPTRRRAMAALNAILKAMPDPDMATENESGRRFIAWWEQYND